MSSDRKFVIMLAIAALLAIVAMLAVTLPHILGSKSAPDAYIQLDKIRLVISDVSLKSMIGLDLAGSGGSGDCNASIRTRNGCRA